MHGGLAAESKSPSGLLLGADLPALMRQVTGVDHTDVGGHVLTQHEGKTMGTVEYRIRSVYGEDRRYVVDPTQAALISALTGRRTLTARDVNTLVELGFTLVQVV